MPLVENSLDSIEEAVEYFRLLLEEHLNDQRSVTYFQVSKHDGRIKIFEVIQPC
jgi:hypothetical protein